MNKYIQCKCDKLGPLVISVEGLQKRIDSSMEYERFYSVLATIEFPQMALRQCRVCKKYYQESSCGQGFNILSYIYEVPEIDKKEWMKKPFLDPFENVVSSPEARNAGL